MPAARGVKRTASKSSAPASTSGPKNKKKRGAIQLEIPEAPKRRGRVLACGQGDVGQLGLGEDVSETTKFKYVAALGDKIIDVYAGGMHTIALDSSGKVWTFGCNDEGALGRATSSEVEEGSPARVTLPDKVTAVCAGDSHSAALLDTGEVYAWGAFRDSHGSMGLVACGREAKRCSTPAKLAISETAVAIASGGDHLVVLTTSGSVYTMGCGEQGQLGRLSQRSATRDARGGFSALLVPSKVTLKFGVSRIWAGYHATFVLDANSEKMFAWGLNNYGQLGITGEKRKTAIFSPTECDAFSNNTWVQVSCGQHHTIALDSSGKVYAVGRCEYGRLGLDREGDAETLEVIPTLQNKKVVSIAAGTSNSFAVTDSGEIYAWGMGSEGQLGTGSSADQRLPTLAPSAGHVSTRALHVSAGGQHTVVLTEDSTSKKESSPIPEEQTEDEKTEDSQEEEDKREEKPKRKREQEGEVSSTSSAVASDTVEGVKPQKVNGDEKKETPMEVDETDKPQEKPTEPETKTEEKTDSQPDIDQTSKPETTDTSSQDTIDTDSDTKSQDSKPETNDNDIEMTDKTVNGAPETTILTPESKSVEDVNNALTTTA